MRRRTTSMKRLLEDRMVYFSSLFPASTVHTTTQMVLPQQGASQKPRRVRKRARAPANNEVHEYKKARLSSEQLYMLEQHFKAEEKLDTKRKHKLSSELGMNPRQVAVWFQNRRARMKTQNTEKKYSNLKASFDKLKSEKTGIEIKLAEMTKRASHFETVAHRCKRVIDILLARAIKAPARPSSPTLPAASFVPSSPTLPAASSVLSVASSPPLTAAPSSPALPAVPAVDSLLELSALESLPSLPAVPSAGSTLASLSLPAFPASPELPAVPSVGSLLELSDLPALPAVPSVGSLLELSGLPSSSPALPALPSVGSSLELPSFLSSNVLPAVPSMGPSPALPAVPSSPALPPLPSTIDHAFSTCWSPTSVLSFDSDQDSPLFEEFGVDAYEDIFIDVPIENITYSPSIELWEWDWLHYLNTFL